jgi:hypothetical protein
MGVELHHDQKTEAVQVQLVAEDSAVPTIHAVSSKERWALKLGLVALAPVLMLGWIAFLCTLIVRFVGSLF